MEEKQSLIDMGYSEEDAVEALTKHPGNVENAVAYLVNKEEQDQNEQKSAVAKSWVCTDTGKRFRTFRDAQLYAEKTGNSNFEESDVEVPPMTAEEKAEKIKQLKEKIAKKRAEREEAEKVAAIEEEKNRRIDGQKALEVREELLKQKRKNEREQMEREKQEEKETREKLRIKVAQDKANRAAGKAKAEGRDPNEAYKEAYEAYLDKFKQAPIELSSSEKFDKILYAIDVLDTRKTVLETLKKMLENVVKNPKEDKFRKIRISNSGFYQRVGRFLSGIEFFKACGFMVYEDDGDKFLLLTFDDLDLDLINLAVTKLNSALSL